MKKDRIINSLRQKSGSKEKPSHFLRNLFIIIVSILVTLSLFIFVLYLVPVLQELRSGQKTKITNSQDLKQNAAYKKQISLMTKDIQRLSRKYNAFTSGESYIVINTTDNRFFLYRNKKLVREGFCSSGSYTLLQT